MMMFKYWKIDTVLSFVNIYEIGDSKPIIIFKYRINCGFVLANLNAKATEHM